MTANRKMTIRPSSILLFLSLVIICVLLCINLSLLHTEEFGFSKDWYSEIADRPRAVVADTTTIRQQSSDQNEAEPIIVPETSFQHDDDDDDDKNVSISITLHPRNHLDFSEGWDKCDPGPYKSKRGRHRQVRSPLVPELMAATNFTATMDLKNVRLLVLGDSVGMQLFRILEVATGGKMEERTVLANAFSDHISYGLSSTGTIGAWRTTALMMREAEGKNPPNAEGGGWNRTTAMQLLNVSSSSSRGEKQHEPIRHFDVLLFRMAHGWMSLQQVTRAAILESLQVASEVFGVRKAILVSLPFVSNVDINLGEGESVPEWVAKNDMIRRLVREFEPHVTVPGLESLVLLDLAQLMNEMIVINSQHLDFVNATLDDFSFFQSNRMFEYLPVVKPAAAHVCAGPLFKKQGRTLCVKNSITFDGMHICPITYAGRFVVAVACLMRCMYGADTRLECQDKCNEESMSLMPKPTNNIHVPI